MKNKNLKLITLTALLSAIFVGTPAVAQSNAPVFNSEQINTEIIESRLQESNAAVPDSGNVFEREMTPLLRETSRKKSLLELKKLDAEIEKLDAEMLRSQQEKLGTRNNEGSAFNLPPGTRIIDASNISNAVVDNPILAPEPVVAPALPVPTAPPQLLPPMPNVPQYAPPPPVDTNAGIRVLMTYGFADDLFAKITSGNQGGYVIRKGDILPNGKVVVKVASNYIEVRAPYTKDKEKNKKIKTQKIYVTGPATGSDENLNEDRSHLIGGGTQSSASIAPPTSMEGVFGDLTIPRTQEQVINVPPPQNLAPAAQPMLNVTPLTGR